MAENIRETVFEMKFGTETRKYGTHIFSEGMTGYCSCGCGSGIAGFSYSKKYPYIDPNILTGACPAHPINPNIDVDDLDAGFVDNQADFITKARFEMFRDRVRSLEKVIEDLKERINGIAKDLKEYGLASKFRLPKNPIP